MDELAERDDAAVAATPVHGAAGSAETDRRSPEEREREADADARALASVLRMRILRMCLDEPLTNKEIAERLGKEPATVLHHVRRLADRGFLAAQPVRRGTRGAREVPYLATRKSWRTPVPGGAHVLVQTFLDEFAEVPDPDDAVMARLGLRLDERGYAELHRRLGELLQDLAGREPDPDGTAYSMFLVVHEDVARRRAVPPAG